MNESQRLLLELLRRYLLGQSGEALPALEEEQLAELIHLSQRHHILPILVEALYQENLAVDLPAFGELRGRALRQTAAGVVRRSDFAVLMQKAEAKGLHPLAVKGLITATYYPSPDCRISSDEDILVPEEEKSGFIDLLTGEGLILVSDTEGVTTFYRKETGLRIEVHTSFFPGTMPVTVKMNRYFERAHQRFATVTAGGVRYRTLAPTDQMLYLVCHAFKHFIHSGFGIRQVCDVILYSAAHSHSIDWEYVMSHLIQIHAHIFFLNLLAIGEKYFDYEFIGFDLNPWRSWIDPDDLLADILDAGVYGNDREDRLHSGVITLQAVNDPDKGRLSVLFPSAESLSGRYPYLKKLPFLLPVAWMTRFGIYIGDRLRGKESSPSKILAMGATRTRLLAKYMIIDGKK